MTKPLSIGERLTDMLKVCVVGLGEVGLPTAEYVEGRHFATFGYDIDTLAVERALSRGIRASLLWHELPACDVYIVCASTRYHRERPDISSLLDIAKKISSKNSNASSKPLVSIESTVPVGTCALLHTKFLKNFNLVHVPHRYWKEDAERFGVRQVRVIGAVNRRSLEKGFKFYRELLDVPLYAVRSIEMAELSKIAENASRYCQIAFAGELKMICAGLGLSFEETRTACNTKWNIQILEARAGVGGHCLPKDTRYLSSIRGKHYLIEGAIKANSFYQKLISLKA